MGILSLFLVASMPVMQVLLIGVLGAYLATGFSNVLTPSARRDINKVVFYVFTPSLMFASLAKTVTIRDLMSWWYMPINIGISFAAGGVLGWLACKILKPPQHLRALVIACCSAGNFGNLLLIIIPAVCDEEGNPFQRMPGVCLSHALSYASASMAIGGLFIWTHTYNLMQNASKLQEATKSNVEDGESNRPLLSSSGSAADRSFLQDLRASVLRLVHELMAPPTTSAIAGFIVGAIPRLKSLVIGDAAPLKVVQESLQLLGEGTIPCITLILGGNLTQGMRKSEIKPAMVAAVLGIRNVVLPPIGIGVVTAAHRVGFLPHDPLYRYVLMMQFVVPPAMNISTMAQLVLVGQDECSVILLWSYLTAAISLTAWSTVFMSILS